MSELEESQKLLSEQLRREIIQQTVKACREYDEQQKIKQAKQRYDWRLRNTRLLLKHYNYFQKHIDNAVYSAQQLAAMDVITEMEGNSAKVNIDSIKKSAQKTFVIMAHINSMLDLYESHAIRKGPAEQRRLRVLRQHYLENRKLADIAEDEHVVERTCQRDLEEAINTLSALIFGIESVDRMVEGMS